MRISLSLPKKRVCLVRLLQIIKVYAFSYQNDTYLFYNQGAAGATGFEANENIVKLSGVNIANLNTSLGTDGEITIQRSLISFFSVELGSTDFCTFLITV